MATFCVHISQFAHERLGDRTSDLLQQIGVELAREYAEALLKKRSFSNFGLVISFGDPEFERDSRDNQHLYFIAGAKHDGECHWECQITAMYFTDTGQKQFGRSLMAPEIIKAPGNDRISDDPVAIYKIDASDLNEEEPSEKHVLH